MRLQVSMVTGKIMRKSVIITVSSALCIALGAAMLSNAVGQVAPSPDYNPYPPGILPADLNPEILRVQKEVQTVFQRYLLQWIELPALTPTGQPPTLQGSGYEAVRILGGLLNYD